MSQQNKFQRFDANYEEIKAKLLSCKEVNVGEVPLDMFKDIQKCINFLEKYSEIYGDLQNSVSTVKDRENQLNLMIDELHKIQNELNQMMEDAKRNNQDAFEDQYDDPNKAQANQFQKRLNNINGIKQRLNNKIQQRENLLNIEIQEAVIKNIAKESKVKGKKSNEYNDGLFSALVSLTQNQEVIDKAQVANALKNTRFVRHCLLRLKTNYIKRNILEKLGAILNSEQSKNVEQNTGNGKLLKYFQLLLQEAKINQELDTAQSSLSNQKSHQNTADDKLKTTYNKNDLMSFHQKVQENIKVMEDIRDRLVDFSKQVDDDVQFFEFKIPNFREEVNKHLFEHNESQDLKKAPVIKPEIEIPVSGSGMRKSEINLEETNDLRKQLSQGTTGPPPGQQQKRKSSIEKFPQPPALQIEGDNSSKGRGGFCGCFG